MKLNEDFSVCEMEGKSFLAPIGAAVIDLRDMFNLNESSAFLVKLLEEKEMTKEELVEAILEEYEADRSTVESDIENFIKAGLTLGFIEE